jgi:hypothetical protein
MDSIGRMARTRFTSPRRLAFLLVLLLVACASVTAAAGEDGWHLEVGMAWRPLYGFGGLARAAESSDGSELDLHVVRSTRGLGARVEGGVHGLHGRSVEILAGRE